MELNMAPSDRPIGELFSPDYGEKQCILASPQALCSLGEVEVCHMTLTLTSPSLQELGDKYPDSKGIEASCQLFQESSKSLLPVAVLLRSGSNHYPFTLDWNLSGADHYFVQQPSQLDRGWLHRLSSIMNTTPSRNYYWNLTQKFFTLNRDKYNSIHFMGFDAAAFRQTTVQRQDREHLYYYIERSYKYCTALCHAFAHFYSSQPGMRLLLQQDSQLWKVRVTELEPVLQWIEAHCVCDASPHVVHSDRFRVAVGRYSGEKWLSNVPESSARNSPLTAEVELLLLYKNVEACESGWRLKKRAAAQKGLFSFYR